MFVVDWIKKTFDDVCAYLGFLPENAKILFIGLDNAGKTTLMHLMKDDRITTHNPTLHPHAEELFVGKIRFRAFDLGGHEAARRIWKDYYADVDAILFIIDAADRTRMAEAAEEFRNLSETEALRDVPFAVLGNKIDIPTACSDEELRTYLQIPMSYGGYGGYGYGGQQQSPQCAYRQNGGGPVEVFMVSLANKMGYGQAFKWIGDMMKVKKDSQQH